MTSDILSFDVSTVSLKGRRDYQEDSLIASFPLGQTNGFAVLADGMGGHTCGHLASAIVVAEIFSQLKMKDALVEDGTLNIPAALEEAAQAANDGVAAYTAKNDEAFGMGSTLLTVMVRRDKLYWVSIGDSPLLLFRDGALRQLNKDHSLAPEIDLMVKAGAMSPEIGRDHPDRNSLTSAISGTTIDKIDCPGRPIVLRPEDVLIAASDGLQYLSNGVIARTLKLNQLGRSVDIADALMEELEKLDHPTQDNAAFIVIKLGVGADERSMEVDIDDLPVLATAEDDDTTPPPKPRLVRMFDARKKSDQAQPHNAVPDAKIQAIAAPPAEAPPAEDPERKAYWYRGQKYYRD